MGRVWRARDELLDRDVALKEIVFPREFDQAERDELQQRQLREARSAARLSHPAVATVFDVVEDLDSPWIVMEFVPGRSLDRVISEQGPLPPHIVARMGQDLLSALAAAHAVGVMHRDVKPSNVLLTGGGRAVLTDFGVATIDGDPSLTRSGMVMGTLAYSAPERVQGDPGTAASDLWSLGLTLYAAAEGAGPYDKCGSVASTVTAIATQDPAPPGNGGPNTRAIMALLNRDPAARPTAEAAFQMLTEAAAAPQAVAHLAAGLQAAGLQAPSGSSYQAGASSRPSSAERAGPQAGDVADPEPAGQPARKPRRRRLVTIAVAAPVVVLGGSLWATHQSGSQAAIQQVGQSAPGLQAALPAQTDSSTTTRPPKPTPTARTPSASPQPVSSPPATALPGAQPSGPASQSARASTQPATAPPTSAPARGGCGTLTAAQVLTAGQALASCSGDYSLAMQSDGNLVLRNSSGATEWYSGTAGETVPVTYASMQGDGNFVLYNQSGTGVWNTGTEPNDGAYLDVGNDGYVRVYSASGTVLWVSRVNG